MVKKADIEIEIMITKKSFLFESIPSLAEGSLRLL